MKKLFLAIKAWVVAHKVVAAVIAGAAALAITTAVVVPVSVSSAKKKRAAEQETQQKGDDSSSGGDQGSGGQQGGGDQGGQQGGGDQGGQQGGGDQQVHTHVYGNLVAAVAADCENDGHAAYYHCEGCDKYFDENKQETTLEALTIAKLGHDYQFDSFVWTTTAGNYTAKAKYVCTHDSKHTELHDAQMSKVAAQHIDPDCESEGLDVWKAVYGDEQETKNEVLPAIGHDYGEPVFHWTGHEAVAEFTCAHDAGHTFELPAQISSSPQIAATCESPGTENITATVEFNDQTYTDTLEDEPVAPLGHNLEHKFCTRCLQYFGAEIEVGTPIYLEDAVDTSNFKAYFRFEWEEDVHYYIELDGWRHELGALHIYYLAKAPLHFEEVTGLGLFYDNTDSPVPKFIDQYVNPEDSADLYLYVEFEFDNGLDAASSALELKSAHTDPDIHGNCAAGDYLGTPAEIGVTVDTGSIVPGTKVFRSFVADPDHTYKLSRQGWIGSEIKLYYYNIFTDEYVEFIRTGAGLFDTPDDTYFGGVILLSAISTGTSAVSSFRVDLVGHNHLDVYGFCTTHHDVYWGEQIGIGSISEDYDNVQVHEKQYFRFQVELGHKYIFNDPDTADGFNYAWMKAYSRNPSNRNMTELELTHSSLKNITPLIDESNIGDGYIYVVIDPLLTVTLGQFTVNYQEHPMVNGLCITCDSAVFEELTPNVASNPFTLAHGEDAYFHYQMSGNSSYLMIEYSENKFGDIPVHAYVFRNGALVELIYSDGDPSQEEYYIPSAQGSLQTGEDVYIHINNNDTPEMTNWTITVSD